MAKRLVDGERREIKASRGWQHLKQIGIKVEAERVDSDTPYVHLTMSAFVWNEEAQRHDTKELTRAFTDVEAQDLIDRLQRALDALPSSK